jgi:hypothetical protein
MYYFEKVTGHEILPEAAMSSIRARDLGVPLDGTPGPLNAITDIGGVEVGYKTLISGEGRLVIGKGPVAANGIKLLDHSHQVAHTCFGACKPGLVACVARCG